ncbi:MAG: hypothetical protein RMI43_04955 [Candidatus Caldarchaeum sp.]|nr:hypothetical protein [Candidatus Caldarchaeum sp.]MCX8201080.1 hypothetical protein [Candidatus Caldarchaeum sp.]MDW8063500.1 hypothetical protein [Candidatus Caldarchaeum sp.]MDW8434910.1 hypothetical protein [Candidatus Caldarchaeum sp.]
MSKHAEVLDLLRKLGGKAMLNTLYDEMKRHRPKSSLQDLLQILMKLEIHGKVRVSTLDEERKVVELLTEESVKTA